MYYKNNYLFVPTNKQTIPKSI